MIKKKKIFKNEQPRFRAGLSCRQELASSVTWLKSYNLPELQPPRLENEVLPPYVNGFDCLTSTVMFQNRKSA